MFSWDLVIDNSLVPERLFKMNRSERRSTKARSPFTWIFYFLSLSAHHPLSFPFTIPLKIAVASVLVLVLVLILNWFVDMLFCVTQHIKHFIISFSPCGNMMTVSLGERRLWRSRCLRWWGEVRVDIEFIIDSQTENFQATTSGNSFSFVANVLIVRLSTTENRIMSHLPLVNSRPNQLFTIKQHYRLVWSRSESTHIQMIKRSHHLREIKISHKFSRRSPSQISCVVSNFSSQIVSTFKEY